MGGRQIHGRLPNADRSWADRAGDGLRNGIGNRSVHRGGPMSGLPMVRHREIGATMKMALPMTSDVGIGRPQAGGATAGLSCKQL